MDAIMDKLMSLSKRRGFMFQSSEIYGGINGFWDYGPLGVELKRNIKDVWWNDVVRRRNDIVGLDSAIIMNPKVWEASGHIVNFNDPLVDCMACKSRYRADKVYTVKAYNGEKLLVEKGVNADSKEQAQDVLVATANSKIRRRLEKVGDAIIWETFLANERPEAAKSLCPSCGGELTEARKFNMMFKTFIGAMEDSTAIAYLRPETAQGIFANYKNVMDSSRVKLPFGIAQQGKSFRNEINPRNYTFRSREFEQMEIEFFCHPDEAEKWYIYWRDTRYQWYVDLGLTSEKLHLRNHDKDELAHYAQGCADIEYDFPFGTSELEGIANRGNYDLTQHQKHSGKDLSYFDDKERERFIPHVIEPSGGIDRAILAFLCEAYTEDEAPTADGKTEKRVVLRLHPKLAPIKVAVFPLVNRDGMPEIARKLSAELQKDMAVFYDDSGAVGRRYRRQDECGTPYCITIDSQTLSDETVTLRDRDTMDQIRVKISDVGDDIRKRIASA